LQQNKRTLALHPYRAAPYSYKTGVLADAAAL
jgi:hypothetical protein